MGSMSGAQGFYCGIQADAGVPPDPAGRILRIAIHSFE
jgi:hypothetical protein